VPPLPAAKVRQAFDQAAFLLIGGAAVKMFATEIVIQRPIFKHVVDGREDGSCDRHDSLLRTASGFVLQSKERETETGAADKAESLTG
jgi:hypothetical protein